MYKYVYLVGERKWRLYYYSFKSDSSIFQRLMSVQMDLMTVIIYVPISLVLFSVVVNQTLPLMLSRGSVFQIVMVHTLQ